VGMDNKLIISQTNDNIMEEIAQHDKDVGCHNS